MANIFEAASMTLKNGMTLIFKDGKARALLDKIQGALSQKYGPDNPPPGGIPSGGTTDQVLKKLSGADYDVGWGAGGGGGGAVDSVNGKVGAVTLDASDVGALPDTTVIPSKTSDLANDSGFVNASGAAAAAPVQSVNGKVGAVSLDASDVGALPDTYVAPVTSVNGQQGDVSIPAFSVLDAYPIGSLYLSVNSTSPAVLFGGTWVQIEDTFLLAAGTTYTAGDTGGQASYSAADMPKHSHTRGTMEITGSLSANRTYSGSPYSSGSMTGAFQLKTVSGQQYYLNGRTTGSGWYDVDFVASNSWTGSTSESGTNDNATIMPPYLAVYIWKRTA